MLALNQQTLGNDRYSNGSIDFALDIHLSAKMNSNLSGKSCFRFNLVFLIIASTTLLVNAAETLSVVPDSAQGLGIVGGRFANLSDASAVRVSPANILEIKSTELLINTAVWNGNVGLDSANGASVELDQPWVIPASMYLVVPVIPGKLAFGMGLSTPFGLATVYPKDMDPRLRYVLPYQSSLLAVDFTPAIAFKVSDTLSFAAGLDVIYSELRFKQAYPWSAAIPGSADGEIDLRGNGWGLGAYMGMNWQVTKGQRIAFIGRLPVKIRYSGNFHSQGMPAALKAAGFTDESDFNSDMTFPGSLAIGYGVDLTDRLTLGFDFQWSANSSHDDIPLNIGNNQALLPTKTANLGWKNSIDLGTGLTYTLNEHWKLRAGYLFSENSQPALNYTPSSAANDRHVFSLGIGWKGENRAIDLAYAFVYNPTRAISGAAQPAFNGNYTHQWNVLSLSVTQIF